MNNWIDTFKKALDSLGRRSGCRTIYALDRCREHADCLVVQLPKHTEHVRVTEHSPVEAARMISQRSSYR